MSRTNGTEKRLVFQGGKPAVQSVHDPEFSPNSEYLIFSKVNPDHANFRFLGPNTAHDIYRVRVDGRGLTRLSKPGPISIIPDWKDGRIIYTELDDRERPVYTGLSIISADGGERRRIKNFVSAPKWIP